MDEYINDVDKYFRLCIKLENLLSIFYYVSVFISLIICIKFNDILCITLIIIHVLYIMADAINDIIFKSFAENERRKTLLSNAYGSELTDKKAIGYYNNNEKNSIKKLGINVFESTFFTKNNTNIMIKQNAVKMIIDVIIWLVIVLIMKDKNIVLCITQSIFSSEILIGYFKLLYFNNKANGIYNKLFTLFITNKYSNKNESQLLEYSFEYECLKSSAHILLSSNNFTKNNAKWTVDWETIKNKIK